MKKILIIMSLVVTLPTVAQVRFAMQGGVSTNFISSNEIKNAGSTVGYEYGLHLDIPLGNDIWAIGTGTTFSLANLPNDTALTIPALLSRRLDDHITLPHNMSLVPFAGINVKLPFLSANEFDFQPTIGVAVERGLLRLGLQYSHGMVEEHFYYDHGSYNYKPRTLSLFLCMYFN